MCAKYAVKRYNTKEEAYAAYCKFARAHFGEFACTPNPALMTS
jgi:hypothetical protein